ncbi:MAG: ribonuclease HII [Eubacterium sp.]|nr:ribonuclease HII [Eubacterium sp.]
MGDIRKELKAIKDMDFMALNDKVKALNEFVETYSLDQRSGILPILESARKLIDNYTDEIKRVELMKHYDLSAGDEFKYICGVDEVGRGPLAGPILAAAVILPRDYVIPYVNDSKQVKAELRERLYDEITANAISWAVGMRNADFIDSEGISLADSLSMRDSVLGLSVKPDLVLVDAFPIPDIDFMQRSIIKGDATSYAIAAASIVAKVTRDRMMEEYGKEFPEYGFEQNAGYGTKKHTDALQAIGPCRIHRRSFISKYIK